MDVVPQSQHLLLLRRRKRSCHNNVSNSVLDYSFSNDLELLSINPPSCTYTSLKDLLPSPAVNSPRPSPAQSESDICIRNRLVKQAAWSYLQPMSTPRCSPGGNFFLRILPRLTEFVGSVRVGFLRILRRMLQVIQIRATS